MTETAGCIESIWRYPIKSFQGESIVATRLDGNGIYADRPLALREKATGKILSGKHAKLGEQVLQFTARYESEPRHGQPLPVVVARVGEQEIRSDDPVEFARRCGAALGIEVELLLAGDEPALFDIYYPEMEEMPFSDTSIEFPLALAEQGSFVDLEPLHILSTASMAQLASLAPDSEIATGRFRPSVVIDTGDTAGFTENSWGGRTAQLGGATLEFGETTPRCIMTTRPQGGLPRDTNVLRTLAQQNMLDFMGMKMPCLGIYARVIEPGSIKVGDTLCFN